MSKPSTCNLTQEVPLDPNVVGRVDETPLMVACSGGHVETACLLLEAGADKDRIGIQSQLPCHFPFSFPVDSPL